jgi:hypothetical protein
LRRNAKLTMATDILAQRSRGRSKLSTIRDGFPFLAAIVTIARLYNPLKFFGLIGAPFSTSRPAARDRSRRPLRPGAAGGGHRDLPALHDHGTDHREHQRRHVRRVLHQVLTIIHPHRPCQPSFWGAVLLGRRLVRLRLDRRRVLGGRRSAQPRNDASVRADASRLCALVLRAGRRHLFLTGSHLIIGQFLIAVLEEAEERRRMHATGDVRAARQ